MSFKSVVQKHYRQKTVVPKGWSTIAMVAKELGVNRSRAQEVALSLVADGLAERKKIKMYNDAGTVALAYIYRIKE